MAHCHMARLCFCCWYALECFPCFTDSCKLHTTGSSWYAGRGLGCHQTCNSLGCAVKVDLPVMLQACSDAARFLDERKGGMMALLERSVRDALLQHKVPKDTQFHYSRMISQYCYHCYYCYIMSLPALNAFRYYVVASNECFVAANLLGSFSKSRISCVCQVLGSYQQCFPAWPRCMQ